MTDHVSLLFGVHAHQPAGNFPEVVGKAQDLCYQPFLQTLHAFPDFRFSFHCSGPLLNTLLEHYPDDMRLLEEMVARGQVELFGGGSAEPVLVAIPDRDRRGQLRALSQALEARFGHAPQGAWLTERVWESTVVPALADCGIGYVTVDDYHFLCAGCEAGQLDGYFTTEEDGRRLDLFPISEALRYRIPFAPADEVVAYLEGMAGPGGPAAIYFDDIEKLGIWPETHDWVYGRGWLSDFIRGVLGSKRIVARTFADFRHGHRTRGIVYLPTTAYIEMNEWTLPARAAHQYNDLVRQQKEAGHYTEVKPFLRGGIWRNFLSRYPESNWMHKRMLALSARLAACSTQPPDPALTNLLYAAQANDAYWHGLFGGLYLPHLRRGVYRALISLEAALDRIAPRVPRTQSDLDLDGIDEVFLTRGALQAVIKDDGRGSIVELDDYSLAHNFGDTMRRHAEHYHQTISLHKPTAPPTAGIASAHDRVEFRHDIDTTDLMLDESGRALFVDFWESSAGEVSAIRGYVLLDDNAREASARLRAGFGSATVEKDLSVQSDRVEVAYRFFDVPAGRFRVRLDLALPSCDGVGGRFIHDGAICGGFGTSFVWRDTVDLHLDDLILGGSIGIHCTRPVDINARPHRTVSQSEAGFEKIMQSVELTLSVMLTAGDHEIVVSLTVKRHERNG
jgi:alpha-amylase/alpha-mannosidase (GH57 family)